MSHPSLVALEEQLVAEVAAQAGGLSDVEAVAFLADALDRLRSAMNRVGALRADHTRRVIASAGSVRKAAEVLGCSPSAVANSAARSGS
jgi:hypothetical protein